MATPGNDLSLLFRIRGEASGVKTATAETRAAIAQLRSQFGNELNQMTAASTTALSEITSNLNLFVGQRIPLVGGAFIRVSENLRSLGGEADKQAGKIKKVSDAIADISKTTSRSTGDITRFLTEFVKIEGQANRDAAAVRFFGAELIANNQKLVPALEKTGAGLAAVSSGAATTGGSLAAMAGPIGITIIAVAALAAGAALLAKQLFDTTRFAAEFEGKMFDMSQATGVAVETLSTFEILSRTTGGNIDGIAASLGIFQKNLEDAQDPTSKEAELLKQLGVEATDTESALRQTLASLAAMPEGFQQTSRALELFGRGGKQILAILKETNGDLDKATQKFRDMGILISGDAARSADQFNDSLAILQFQLRAITAEITRDALPTILQIVRGVSEFIRENKTLIKDLSVLIGFIARVVGLLVEFNLEIRKPGIAVFTTTIELLATAYERIATAVGFIIGHPLPPQPATTAEVAEAAKPKPAGSRPTGEVFGTPELQKQLQAQRELAGIQAAAAEEAKRTAGQRIADAQRAFQAGEITRKQELAAVISGLAARRDAELQGLAHERELKVTEAILARDDLKKRTEIENQIIALDQRAADITERFERESADRRLQARLAERQALQEHERAKLDILLAANEAQIKLIEEQAATGTKTAEQAASEIEKRERTALAARRELLKRELQQSLSIDEGLTIKAQLAKLDIEEQELERKQRERRRQLAAEENARDLAEAKRRFEINESLREEELRKIEDLLDRQAISESDAIKLQLQVLEAAHLERINLLLQEEQAATTSAERKKEILTELTLADQQFTDNAKQLSQERIDALLRERGAGAPGAKGLPEGRAERQKEIFEETIGKTLEKQLGLPPPSFDLWKEAFKELKSIGADALDSLAFGIGSLVENWVLLGETGPAAMKKLVASVLAGVAAQAAIKAVFELAQGFASLFFNPAEAAAHFTAAALFGSIATGAALAGRGIAGDAFKQKPATGGGANAGASGGSSGSDRDRTIREARLGGGQDPNKPIDVHVTLNLDGAVLEQKTVKLFERNGELRSTLRRDLLGEAVG